MMGRERPLRLAVLLTLFALLFAAIPAPANDPPYRMEEATPDSSHLSFGGKGLWGYADASGEYALVATGGALAVIDVSDPGHPVVASRVPSTGADLKEVKTYRHYAFCVNQYGPLQIVDLSDPYHAYTIANYLSNRIFGCHNIWIEEDGFAYLALQGTGTQDLRILDLTQDPLRPVERGFFVHPQQGGLNSAHDVYVRHDTCYASWFYGGLLILDVRDKDLPHLLSLVNYPSPATHNAWPTPDGRFVCTTDEQVGGHLRIWGIGGRLGVEEVAEYATDAEAIIHNVHLKGNRAYIAYYTAGVRVVDLTDPRRPLEVGRFDTSRFSAARYAGCWSVFPYAPSGLIYASDMAEGLYVLRFLDAQDGVVRGTLRVHAAESARIAGAEIWFPESEVRVVSDRIGYFQAHLYEGIHTGEVKAPGFHTETFTATVTAGDATNVTVILDPLPGAIELVEEPGPPVLLPDGRLSFEIRLRAHGTPIAEVMLHYRAGSTGSFRAVPMEKVAPDDERYRGFVPELLPGVLIHYFFLARDEAGDAIFFPADAPATLLSERVGEVDWEVAFAADFETGDAGFSAGSPDDHGEQGFWQRAIPAATPDSLLIGGRPSQPAADTSPAGPGYCFLTELGAPGDPPPTHDIDGRSTLTSPVLDLRGGDGSPPAAARLRFMLWYVNDLAGSLWQDPFLLEGSSDGGASWRVLEAIRVSQPDWHEVTVDLGRRLDLMSGRVRIRFVGEDVISPSLIEAAVDDFRIEITSGLKLEGIVGQPQVVLLRQNTPNPFNPSTLISYQLKEQRPVRLKVYDVAGHLVQVLVERLEPVGDHAVIWDGRDIRGVPSPSGVYYYRLDAQDFTDTRKMLLLK